MNKIWKPVSGFEGIYEVSNMGDVRSLDRYVLRSDGIKQFKKGVALTHTINQDGYPTVHLSKDGMSKRIAVHILVATEFVDNPNNCPEVNHIDFNRANCKWDNLEWVTHRDNILHTIKAGRHICNDICGEKNPNYKNTTLKEYYANHPEDKMKLARPGKQNGRALPVTLIEPDGTCTHFDYMAECGRYLIEKGYSSAKDPDSVAYRINIARKNNTSYLNCQFI